MRVLLVEDDHAAARGTALMLQSSGSVADHADTAEEARKLIRHYEYDLVLPDIMLPDIEEYEMARRMRPARDAIPVLNKLVADATYRGVLP